jgi:hypothetical protein
MKYIKRLYEWYFHDEFFKDKNRDVKYYLDRIEKERVDKDSIDTLFHWSCVNNFPELALALSKKVDLNRVCRSITYLDFKWFKKILEGIKITNRDFLSYVIQYGSDKDKKFDWLEKQGYKINYQDLLETACFHDFTDENEDVLDVVKYIIKKGADPKEFKDGKISYIKQNCLDVATRYGKNNLELVKYLVDICKVPATWRNIKDTYHYNIKVFDYLIKLSYIEEDHSFSSYATSYDDRRRYTLSQLISLLSINKDDEYIKYLADKQEDNGYNFLQLLNRKKDFKGKGKYDVYLNPDRISILYNKKLY